jgi:hypothetical protein
MMAAATPAEAMIRIEVALLAARVRCMAIRFFPCPDGSRRLVIVCAELANGNDIQVLTRLDFPITVTGDHYDEASLARAFQMPSQSVH